MAVYPNNIRTAPGWNPYRNTGASPTLYDSKPTPGSHRCRYVADSTDAQFPKTDSLPRGYSPFGALIQPYTAGGMAGASTISVTRSAGNLLSGGPMTGAGAISLLPTSGNLALTVGLSGTAVMALTGNAALALTIGLSGSSTFSLTGNASLALIVPFSGTGTFGITGSATLKGRLSMSGEWGGATALSPEGLAEAVWNSNAAAFALAGTMGELLNTAGSGGLSPTQSAQLAELHRVHGLETGTPLVVTSTTRTAGSIVQGIVEAGPTVTVTRT